MLEKLELKIPPLVVTTIFGVIMWGMSILFDSISFKINYLRTLSSLVLSVGVAIALMAVLKFKGEDTTVDPTKPDNSTSLVTGGIYKYTRNPMYLSFFLWLLALSLYIGNPINIFILVLFVFYMNRLQIKIEEEILLEKFDDSYRNYVARTRRWM